MKWITSQISATAECMGYELSEAALTMFAGQLRHLDDEAISRGLSRCLREIQGKDGFPPRLLIHDVLERAGQINEADLEQIAAEQAFDTVVSLADRYGRPNEKGDVELRHITHPRNPQCESCNEQGLKITHKNGARVYADCHCKIREDVPEVETRIADVVRRQGGWGTFKAIKTSSYPFVRRDFITEYKKWEKAETVRAMLSAPSAPTSALSAPGGPELPAEAPHRLEGELQRILKG